MYGYEVGVFLGPVEETRALVSKSDKEVVLAAVTAVGEGKKKKSSV